VRAAHQVDALDGAVQRLPRVVRQFAGGDLEQANDAGEVVPDAVVQLAQEDRVRIVLAARLLEQARALDRGRRAGCEQLGDAHLLEIKWPPRAAQEHEQPYRRLARLQRHEQRASHVRKTAHGMLVHVRHALHSAALDHPRTRGALGDHVLAQVVGRLAGRDRGDLDVAGRGVRQADDTRVDVQRLRGQLGHEPHRVAERRRVLDPRVDLVKLLALPQDPFLRLQRLGHPLVKPAVREDRGGLNRPDVHEAAVELGEAARRAVADHQHAHGAAADDQRQQDERADPVARHVPRFKRRPRRLGVLEDDRPDGAHALGGARGLADVVDVAPLGVGQPLAVHDRHRARRGVVQRDARHRHVDQPRRDLGELGEQVGGLTGRVADGGRHLGQRRQRRKVVDRAVPRAAPVDHRLRADGRREQRGGQTADEHERRRVAAHVREAVRRFDAPQPDADRRDYHEQRCRDDHVRVRDVDERRRGPAFGAQRRLGRCGGRCNSIGFHGNHNPVLRVRSL
jgi:hypothetical protein